MASGRRGPTQGQPVPAQASPPPADRGSPLAPDAQLAAVAAAATTLAQQLAVQTGAVSANTVALVNAGRQPAGRGADPRPTSQPLRPTVGPAPGGAAGLLAGGVTGIVSQLVAPLAPLAALAQVVNATTSGFGSFLKMTGLITTSLAGFFLPAMLVASGVVFAVAQQMQGPMLEAMQKLEPQMIALKNATEGVAGAFDDVNEALKLFGGELDLTAGTLGGVNTMLGEFGLSLKDVINFLTAPTLAGVVGGLKSDEPNMLQRAGRGVLEATGVGDALSGAGVPGVPRYQPPGGGGTTAPAPTEGFLRPPDSDVGPRGFLRPPDSPEPTPTSGVGGFMAEMRRGMGLAMQSMRREVGGPAQQGQDLSNVWRAATMAGLSVDPIQAKMNQTMIDQLAVMEKMLAELEKREAQYK